MGHSPFYIRPNHARKFPGRMMFLDTETTLVGSPEQGHHVFNIGCTTYLRYDWNKNTEVRSISKRHTTKESFIHEIVTHCYSDAPLYLYGSNISFDIAASGLIPYLTRQKWTCKIYYEKGMVFILIVSKDANKGSLKTRSAKKNVSSKKKPKKRTLKFLSMQNFIPTSIKKIGMKLGIEKLEIKYDTDDIESLFLYCERDVLILKQAIIQWYQFVWIHDLGGSALTVAGQAFRAFRHRFMKHKILVYGDTGINDLERLSYHGGRCECFNVGTMPKQQYVQVDINSMYSFLMEKNKYPNKVRGFIQRDNVSKLRGILRRYCVTALVYIETDIPLYAKRINERTCFPVGSFWTVLTSRELEKAFEYGHLKKVYSGVYYVRHVLFDEYVAFFYNLRLKAQKNDNMTYSTIIKLFMNSLYGKFGEKRDIIEKTETVETDDFRIERCYDAVENKYFTERVLFHKLEIISGEEDGRNAFPAISSHITADGRLLLWDFMTCAGLENVLYVDTDSMIVTREIFDAKLKRYISDKLGDIKIEIESDDLVLNNLKDYSIGKKSILKGVQWIEERDGKKIYKALHSYGLNTLARKGITDRAVLRPVELELKREYTKGTVAISGRVSPFEYFEPCVEPCHDLKCLSIHEQYSHSESVL